MRSRNLAFYGSTSVVAMDMRGSKKQIPYILSVINVVAMDLRGSEKQTPRMFLVVAVS